jgi:broad specificity phosphatase PhoE
VTTTFHLVRHGSHDRLDRTLCGRMAGVRLGDAGRAEAEAAAARLEVEPLVAVISSPLERCQETATAVAAAHGLSVEEDAAFIELDFGEWTGLSFDALHRDPRFEPWNSRRSLNRPPGGESLGEAQMRAVRGLEALRARFLDAAVAIVSHSDVIKALAAHVLGLNLDFYHRFEVDPASVTTLVLGDWGAKLLRLNVR